MIDNMDKVGDILDKMDTMEPMEPMMDAGDPMEPPPGKEPPDRDPPEGGNASGTAGQGASNPMTDVGMGFTVDMDAQEIDPGPAGAHASDGDDGGLFCSVTRPGGTGTRPWLGLGLMLGLALVRIDRRRPPASEPPLL